MIKKEAADIFFNGQARQSELASNLDEAFDITHGGFYQNQAFWVCDPKAQTAERFGFSQELVALYSPHPKPDARLLTSIRNVLDRQDLKTRADRVVSLVIHEAESSAVMSIIDQEPDRILVPIRAQELADKAKPAFFVRSKIAERVGQFDLFGMSSPLQHDRYFYGRQTLVQELLTRATSRREHSGLFGLRKTGKTSVLFAMQRRLAGTDIHSEYIDCQNPGIYGGRWWHVLDEIARRIGFASNAAHSGPPIVVKDSSSSEAATQFMKIVKVALGEGHFSQIVLLFDEIEFLTPDISNNLGSHWDADFQTFWQTIRATSQETGGRLTFVVAGVNPTSVEEPNFQGGANPIFQLASPYYLEPLSTPAVREMVRTIGKYSGMAFDEGCFAYLQKTYGGHPYLIRLACSEVARAKGVATATDKTQISLADFSASRDAIRTRLTQPMKDILLSLVWWYPEEYEFLRVLAEDADFAQQFLVESPEISSRFEKYGLLDASSRVFQISDMQDFLRQNGAAYKKAISPFRRGDLPAEVLPSRPDIDDLSVLFERRTEVEIALRKLLLMMFGIVSAFDDSAISKRIVSGLPKNGSRDAAQLFVGRRPQDAINELFLSDLKPVFVANWSMFTAYFGIKCDRFEMNMDTINLARRVDSHTKPFTPAEREHFMNSYSWFDVVIKRIPGMT